MCGIVGVFCRKEFSAENYKASVDRSLDEIRYRGPDGKGIYIYNNIALGHVRLSIIDLTNAGHQPMLSSDDRHVITYNGEVYNYNDLKQDLGSDAVSYKSNTDTEIILEYFKIYGVSAFKKFNGMFAFSIVDKKNKKAYLVRDRFGIKPLYYYKDNNKVVFASEIKAIQSICKNKGINEKILPEWSYYGNSLRDETLHKDVKQLLPGCYIEIDTDTLEFKQKTYWQPESLLHKRAENLNNSSLIIKRIRSLLETAVCSQLVGDVPVGVFLSGGVDSSAITAFAANNYDKQIDTFSVGFDFQKGVGELPKASIVAKQFNTNHHELRVTGYDVADIVQKMVYHHDGPFSDAANIPLYLLGEEVKGKVKVVLQGDGGDEIFAGYRRYNTLSRRTLWKPFIGLISNLHESFLTHNEKFYLRQRYLNALKNRDEGELMALMLTVEDKCNSPTQIFSKDLRARVDNIDPFKSYKACNNRFLSENIVQRMLFTDTQLILPSIFLEKVDRSTMATSLEVRVPFLDNSLTEYVMSLPSELKIRRGQNKWLLKQAMRGILPDSILFSKKTGFNVPYQLWLKGPLNELFNDKVLELKKNKCTLLDWKYIERLMYENKNGLRDNGFMLWKTLNLMIWLSNNGY